MNRRKFLATSAVTSAALVTSVTDRSTLANAPTVNEPALSFKLNYAPHFGMFKNHTGDDLVAQLQFFKEQGFNALEDNGLPQRPVADQEKIGKTLADLKMTMGVFVATNLKHNPLKADEDEFLTVEKIPVKDALKMAEHGEMPDAKSLAALLMARSYLE